ncbi:MAG: hypothetical protein HQ591_06595 [candidate division Zixibacteria bacterium]|nr:hypothetical protein [Candidatus Tariuqbacter arcticus]
MERITIITETRTAIHSRRIIFPIIYVILCVFIVLIFISPPGINGYERAMFGDMVYGQAHKPFVYRALLPMIIRTTTSIIPEETDELINKMLDKIPSVKSELSKSTEEDMFYWEKELYTEYIVAIFYIFLFLLGFVFSLRYLFEGVYKASILSKDILAISALLILPSFFDYMSYLYDFPALCLFTLGLGLMVREKWVLFLIIYTLGCINKETTILLSLIFAIYFVKSAKMLRSKFYWLLAVQLIVFILVKLMLFFIFLNNPGSFVEFHFVDHNLVLLGNISLAAMTALAVIAGLVFYRWTDKPLFLRDALWIVAPLFILTLFMGYIDEQRDFYEAYPVVLLLIYHSAAKIFAKV